MILQIYKTKYVHPNNKQILIIAKASKSIHFSAVVYKANQCIFPLLQ